MNFSRFLTVTSILALSVLSIACAEADSHDSADAPTVLITGANRGLGLEFARQYAEDGWQVIGTARDPADAEELRATGARVLQLDVLDQASVDALARALDGEPIDLLINNAGIFPRESSLAAVDLGDYERTLAVNTTGPVRVTQALLPNLRAGDRKLIVNMSSQLGSITNNGGGFYGYRESKAALNMFTKTLAQELGPDGFIALAIHPGWVSTDMGGPAAPLEPRESVAGMRAVIGGLTAGDNGEYRAYNGEEVAW